MGIAAVVIAGTAIGTGVGYLFVLAAAVGLGSLSVLLFDLGTYRAGAECGAPSTSAVAGDRDDGARPE